MTLQDLPLRDLVEMEKTLKILRYTYENPSSPSSTCPLCIMYMDEPAEDSSCTICPHISIDGAEYTEAGMPCKSNQRIPPEHREISYWTFRSYTDDEIVRRLKLDKENNNIGTIRAAHIRRVTGWILKVQYEIQRRYGVEAV
mgnify:CR=1 FL=1